MASVGEKLKTARIRKGFTVNRIELVTNIKKKYIEALEDYDFDVFDDKAYAMAYLKTYARYLELDAKELAKEFSRDIGYLVTDKDYSVNIYSDNSRNKLKNYQLMSLVISVLLIVASLSYLGTRDWGIDEIVLQDEIVYTIDNEK